MQHIPLFKEKRMMLKLSNISYERESGKFNFKVFLTVDVSISEVHLRQQARRRRRRYQGVWQSEDRMLWGGSWWMINIILL